jgi:hypothetical protein
MAQAAIVSDKRAIRPGGRTCSCWINPADPCALGSASMHSDASPRRRATPTPYAISHKQAARQTAVHCLTSQPEKAEEMAVDGNRKT